MGNTDEGSKGLWPCKAVATHAIVQPPAAGTNVGWEGPHDARAPHSLNQTVNEGCRFGPQSQSLES